jgi:hypothetical protein
LSVFAVPLLMPLLRAAAAKLRPFVILASCAYDDQ